MKFPNKPYTLGGAAAILGISKRHVVRRLHELKIYPTCLDCSGRGAAGVYILNASQVEQVYGMLKKR